MLSHNNTASAAPAPAPSFLFPSPGGAPVSGPHRRAPQSQHGSSRCLRVQLLATPHWVPASNPTPLSSPRTSRPPPASSARRATLRVCLRHRVPSPPAGSTARCTGTWAQGHGLSSLCVALQPNFSAFSLTFAFRFLPHLKGAGR